MYGVVKRKGRVEGTNQKATRIQWREDGLPHGEVLDVRDSLCTVIGGRDLEDHGLQECSGGRDGLR